MKSARLCLLLPMFAVANSVSAALEFTLTPTVQSGAIGAKVCFVGTLKNTSTTQNLFLNDIHFDVNPPAASALTPDPNVFFANVPGILLPNETYTGPIFTVAVDSHADPGDYTGSVTIRGGTDIFAATDLLSQEFQVSSPSISISATVPDAEEFGPVSGVFTVSRSGSVNYDLTVNYATTGSATNGIRYSSLSGSVQIPSGAASATISIDPIPNDLPDGDQTVILTITPNQSYNVGSPALATVTLHDKPIDTWRIEQFGNQAGLPQISGDGADPDHDGITNLIEYGLLLDPKSSSIGDLPLATIDDNHLQLMFRRNTAATDITYIVEASANLSADDWSPIVTRAPGSGWTANEQGATAVESGSGSFVSVTVTDSVPIIDPVTSQRLPRRFLRLRIER
ncbi:MAG TPA: hypothetical protein VGM62_12095 [Chthoniobacterales bacterium]|jgi:hypothetical protein